MPTQSSGNHVIPFAPVPVSVRDDAVAAAVAEQNGRRTLNGSETFA